MFTSITETYSCLTGHNYEEFVYEYFKSYLRDKDINYCTIKVDCWKNDYPEERKSSRAHNFILKESSLDKETLYIVEQPNGSQSWPDALFIYKNKGLPFEIKCGKSGKITWNSGFPKLDCVYLYNDTVTGKSSLFLGQHIVTQDIIDSHNQYSEELYGLSETLLKKYSFGDYFGYYLRDMWVDNFNYSKNPKRDEWTKETLEFLKTYWT